MIKPGIFQFGRCKIIVSIDNGEWHLSISTANALPSYEETKFARYKYCPDNIYMCEVFPPKKEFVNLHPYCRHLWQMDINKSNYQNERTKKMKPIQWINWFPVWKGFKFKRTNPETDKNAACYLIYKWYILLGFWEIRKFMSVKERKKALKLYQEKII